MQERLQEAEDTIAGSERRRREEVAEGSARRSNLERELQHVRDNEQQGVLQMSKMKQELEEQRKEMSVLQEEVHVMDRHVHSILWREMHFSLSLALSMPTPFL